MGRLSLILINCTLINFVLAGQEASPKPMEFGVEVDHVSASLSLPDRAEEGRWAFDVTVRNTDTKKNQNLFFADRPQGWSWEVEGASGNSKKYSGELTKRPVPLKAKFLYLGPGESKTFKVCMQATAGNSLDKPGYYEIPPGTYRIRLCSRIMDDKTRDSKFFYSNWTEFKIDAEGAGPDAAHRDFPHIAAGLGGKISVPDKPTGALAFDMSLHNFAKLPTDLYMLVMTGFSLEFHPVGDDTTFYRASADYEEPGGNKMPSGMHSLGSRPLTQALRSSIGASRLEPNGTRSFKLDVMASWNTGGLTGKWTMTKHGEKWKSEMVAALPPGRYRVRAFFDPALVLDSVVASMPLSENAFRGIAVTNEIEVDLPLKGAKLTDK